MAITSILEDIPTINPAFNDIECLVDSSQKLQPNFKYVFQVYVNGLLIATKKTIPEPDNQYGYCNIGEIIASYIETQIPNFDTTNGFDYALSSPVLKFDVYYGEEYGEPPATFEPTDSSLDRTAWCASFIHTRWINRIKFSPGAAFDPFVMKPTSTTRPFLTNYKTPKVGVADLGWHFILLEDAADADNCIVNTYDSAGGLINTFVFDNGLAVSSPESLMLSVASAPQSLNNIATLSTGAQPIITSAVDTYTIQLRDSTNATIGEEITFEICEPCRYERYRVHFLNEFGGFDSFNFDSRNQITTSVTRKQYSKKVNRLSSGGIERGQQYDGKQDYWASSQDSLKLRSDYLTEDEHNWLKELVNTTQLYLEFDDSGTNNFRPIRMKSSSWKQKETTIDKLFKLELDVEFSHADRKQRR